MKHQWVALIPYDLDDLQAKFVMSGGLNRLVLRPTMVRWQDVTPVGCFVCEQLWKDVKDKPCPGQPPGRLEYVVNE